MFTRGANYSTLQIDQPETTQDCTDKKNMPTPLNEDTTLFWKYAFPTSSVPTGFNFSWGQMTDNHNVSRCNVPRFDIASLDCRQA